MRQKDNRKTAHESNSTLILRKKFKTKENLQKRMPTYFEISKICVLLHSLFGNAQMAELVDALVSNTSGFTSMPVRSRLWVLEIPDYKLIIRDLSFYKGQNRDNN